VSVAGVEGRLEKVVFRFSSRNDEDDEMEGERQDGTR